jgi:hypothetical protein
MFFIVLFSWQKRTKNPRRKTNFNLFLARKICAIPPKKLTTRMLAQNLLRFALLSFAKTSRTITNV